VATDLLVSGRRAGPERHLVPAARLDELLSRAAAVGVGVGHGTAQLPDGWCLPCGLFGSPAFCAVQFVFGGLTGGEEQPAGRSGTVAVAGNGDHAGRVSVTAPVFPVRAVTAAAGVDLEFFAADAARTHDGLVPIPAVVGVVEPLCLFLTIGTA
jgi:hypothetical protein